MRRDGLWGKAEKNRGRKHEAAADYWRPSSYMGCVWMPGHSQLRYARQTKSCIGYSFEIAQKYGVEIIKSVRYRAPSKIVYEDEYQIGVVDHSETLLE